MYKKLVTWAAAAVFVASILTPALASPDCVGGVCAMPKTTATKAKVAPAKKVVKAKAAGTKVAAKSKSAKSAKSATCVVNGKTVKCDMSKADCEVIKGKGGVCPRSASTASPKTTKLAKKSVPKK